MTDEAIIDTASREHEWAGDFEKLDRYTRLGYSLIDIEIAKKWHAAYRKAQNSNLLRKQENERMQEDAEQYEKVIEARSEIIDQQAAQIKELEGMLDARSKEIVGRIQECQACQIDQLRAEGKIGPDADAKPHCWQITEEREEVILRCKRMLTFMKENDAPCHDVEKITKDESVLAAMMEEAGQE